ncbi:MAG: response regulator [Verrucomicrobiales bacterium]
MRIDQFVRQPSRPINVLLVDDNDMDNEFHKIVIEDTDLADSIAVAFNGKEAIDTLQATAGTPEEPTLILLDINMPVMNGFEFLEALKDLRSKLSLQSIVIVMLTTSLLDEDRYRTESTPGLKGYMHKPLTDESFREIVSAYFCDEDGTGTSPAPQENTPP